MAGFPSQVIPVSPQRLGSIPSTIQGMGPGQELGMIRMHPSFPFNLWLYVLSWKGPQGEGFDG